MIEYVSKQGGRHLYNEDMINLQNLCNSFAEFFKDCGKDFIITGLEEYITHGERCLSEGYVWLDGKVRYVPRINITRNHNVYICPVTKDSEQIVYATPGITGPIYRDYAVEIRSEKPSGKYIYIGQESLPANYSMIRQFLYNYSIVKDENVTNYVSSPIDFNELFFYGGFTVYHAQGFFELYTIATFNSSNELVLSGDEQGINGVINFESLYVEEVDSWHGGLWGDDSDDSDGSIFGQDLDDIVIKLPTVNTKNVAVPVMKAGSMSLNGVPLDLKLRRKTPNTEWIALQGTDNMVCKQVYKDIYITGRLPFADKSVIIKSTEQINDYCIKKQTSVKLPDGISKPTSTTIFNVRGGNHSLRNGSADLYFDSEGYLCIEMDSREAFIPSPSSVFWHYIID